MPSRSPRPKGAAESWAEAAKWTTIAKSGKRRQAQELVLTADEQKTLTRSLLDATPREMEFHAQKRTEATCGVMALRNALQPMKSDMVHDAQMRICAKVLKERIVSNNDPSEILSVKTSGALCDENGNYHESILGLWTEFNLGEESWERVDPTHSEKVRQAFEKNFNLVLHYGARDGSTSGHWLTLNYVAGRAWAACSASSTKMPKMLTVTVEEVGIDVASMQAWNWIQSQKSTPNTIYTIKVDEHHLAARDLALSTMTDEKFEADLTEYVAKKFPAPPLPATAEATAGETMVAATTDVKMADAATAAEVTAVDMADATMDVKRQLHWAETEAVTAEAAAPQAAAAEAAAAEAAAEEAEAAEAAAEAAVAMVAEKFKAECEATDAAAAEAEAAEAAAAEATAAEEGDAGGGGEGGGGAGGGGEGEGGGGEGLVAARAVALAKWKAEVARAAAKAKEAAARTTAVAMVPKVAPKEAETEATKAVEEVEEMPEEDALAAAVAAAEEAYKELRKRSDDERVLVNNTAEAWEVNSDDERVLVNNTAEAWEVNQNEFVDSLGRYHPVRDPSTLRLPPLEGRCISWTEVLKELRLKKKVTSGHNFNCLAFSIMIGSNMIAPEAHWMACDESDIERRLTHETIMSRLPPEAAKTAGPNGVWWAGETRESLNKTFADSEFMGEAHVHGFCNRLARSIVVIDVREPAVVMCKYQPGYAVQLQLSMHEALELRNSREQPIWVLLEPNHFSALLPLQRPTADDSLTTTEEPAASARSPTTEHLAAADARLPTAEQPAAVARLPTTEQPAANASLPDFVQAAARQAMAQHGASTTKLEIFLVPVVHKDRVRMPATALALCSCHTHAPHPPLQVASESSFSVLVSLGDAWTIDDNVFISYGIKKIDPAYNKHSKGTVLRTAAGFAFLPGIKCGPPPPLTLH